MSRNRSLPGHRNDVWEAGHVHTGPWLEAAGYPRGPVISWFVDHATSAVTGISVSPGPADLKGAVTALRAALCRGREFGPFGGVPRLVRIDSDATFLHAHTLEQAHRLLPAGNDMRVLTSAPGNATAAALKHSLSRALLRYSPRRAHAGESSAPGRTSPYFDVLCEGILAWVRHWNYEHPISARNGRTPYQLWHDDPTPVRDIARHELHPDTHERDGPPLVIGADGVHWRRRCYIAQWMRDRVGAKVHLRYMPHHRHHIELYDADTGTFLGPASLWNTVGCEQQHTRPAATPARERR